MIEHANFEQNHLSTQREEVFKKAEKELHFPVEVYRLGDRFEGLSNRLAEIIMLDTTKIPGCHYGAKNVFVPIIHHMETSRGFDGKSKMKVSPETAILVEPSTGNGWVAFSDAAEKLGYEHAVIMPDGLPEARYKHPQDRKVTIIKTPKKDYASGMPKKLAELMQENKQRLREGKKIYASPNHAVSNAEITIKAMSDIGRQLVEKIGNNQDGDNQGERLMVVVSMGNGASLCSVGEYVKEHCENASIVATEDFAYGKGFDRFRKSLGWSSYSHIYGINPGNPELMKEFSTFGTNAPIGIEMPLQERAFFGDLIGYYELFTDSRVLETYKRFNNPRGYYNATLVPNRDKLPEALLETYGNSTLGNIAVASQWVRKEDRVVAMAYDSRKNY